MPDAEFPVVIVGGSLVGLSTAADAAGVLTDALRQILALP